MSRGITPRSISADRHVGTAVLPVVADPDGASALQPNSPRPLDLQKECVNRIVDPEEFQPAPGERPILDFGARRRLGAEIWRLAVKRGLIAAMTLPRAVELDLVISGEQSFRFAVVRYGKRNEPLLEKFPGSRAVLGRQRLRRLTYWPPVSHPPEINARRNRIERSHICPVQEPSTGFQENRNRRRDVILRPAR